MGYIFAIMVALGALNSQPQPLPTQFLYGAQTRAEVVDSEDFIGIEWTCDPVYVYGTPATPSGIARFQGRDHSLIEDEVCYAGLDKATGQLVTGP